LCYGVIVAAVCEWRVFAFGVDSLYYSNKHFAIHQSLPVDNFDLVCAVEAEIDANGDRE